MTEPLRILHAEDDPADAEIVQATIEAHGIPCAVRVVDDRARFIAAMEQGDVDLVLTDMVLPHFDGLSAIALMRERWPDIPIILLSGTMGEELAIDTMRNGATDYVLKGRLTRLGPAVSRAMVEVAQRKEHVRVEAQFLEAQKMEVIGRLAGSVAHDFNNIIAVVTGFTELIAAELGPSHPLQGYVDEVLHASARAVGLTRQLLIFSRKETVQPVVLNLNALLTGLRRMLRRLVDEDIDLVIELDPELGCVMADAGYIGQVLMNLVVNARDAMPDGGRLVIATRNHTCAAGDPSLPPDTPPAEYVALSVCDDGAGMTADVSAHVFDAFFTTKSPGKGTGLGLATCRTIVAHSGGHIGFVTEPGLGSTFTAYLPRITASPDALDALPSIVPSLKGKETLLLVEDEPSVRKLAAGVLTASGYTVLSAPNGQEALLVLRHHEGDPVSLVITDVIMPVMGGRALADQLQISHPRLPVLFMSGYPDDALSRSGVMEPGIEFLSKPYSTRTLLSRVQDILHPPGQSPAAT